MGAAFLATTAYIQNWIKALEGDSRLMITAASAAQKAVDSILGTRFEDQDSEDKNEQVEGSAIAGALAEQLAWAA